MLPPPSHKNIKLTEPMVLTSHFMMYEYSTHKEAEAMAMPLTEHSGDVLSILVAKLADALLPMHLARFASTCSSMHLVSQPLLERLRSEDRAVRKLCSKVGVTPEKLVQARPLSLTWSLRSLDAIDARVVGQVLSSGALEQLQRLTLIGNRIGDGGTMQLASSFAHGALPQLQNLYLNENEIGDAGLCALAIAFESGALPALRGLNLRYNTIGDLGMVALANAAEAGALANLTGLSLSYNQIGDGGMKALAHACSAGALGKLEDVGLSGNPGNPDAMLHTLKESVLDQRPFRIR